MRSLVAVLLLCFCSCNATFAKPPLRWGRPGEPRIVHVDARMSDECRLQDAIARQFWTEQAGVVFEMRHTPTVTDLDVVRPPEDISVTARPSLQDWSLAQAYDVTSETRGLATWAPPTTGKISRCVIVMLESHCHWLLLAHEYGHCFGLEHSPDPGSLMYYAAASAWGDYVSRGERDWVSGRDFHD